MRSFKDTNGREWKLSVDGWTVRQVKRQTGYLMMDAVDQEKTLFNDTALVVEVLWVLCSEQAASLGVSEKDFCQSIRSDSLEHGTEALGREIVDFFANQESAKAAQSQLDVELTKQKQVSKNGSAVKTCTDFTSRSPESLESILGATHSVS